MGGNGHVIPNTPIAVDVWQIKKYPQAKVFFLTHFHSDHMVGLTPSWKYPIYTSPITTELLRGKLKINASLINKLELNRQHLIPLDSDKKEMLTVTLIDANHCPGSVMFLFSGYFGNILYTGDFRYNKDILNNITLPIIDILYLDNTYCSPKCDFYSRKYAMETIIERLRNCLKKSKRVMLGVDNLGKEELLVKIHQETKCKIGVEENLMKTLEILKLSHIATTDNENTKICAVATSKISTLNMMKWNKTRVTCAILPTARYMGLGYVPFSRAPNIHIIPYSNHSSYQELNEFVKQVHPCCVEPIIKKNAFSMMGTNVSSRTDMNVFVEFISEFAPKNITIPESVWKYMNSPLILPTGSKILRKYVKPKFNKRGIDYSSSHNNNELELNNSHTNDDESNASALNSTDDEDMWEIVYISASEPPKILMIDPTKSMTLVENGMTS